MAARHLSNRCGDNLSARHTAALCYHVADMDNAKVYFMGQRISLDELPEPEPSLEAHFKPVVLTPKALDLASQIVPPEHWMPKGLHSWLQSRADAAFSKLTTNQREIQQGRLKYFFEIQSDIPVLAKVTLC